MVEGWKMRTLLSTGTQRKQNRNLPLSFSQRRLQIFTQSKNLFDVAPLSFTSRKKQISTCSAYILIQTTPSTIHTQHGSRRWYINENPNNFGGKYLPIKIFECRPLLYGQRMMYGDGPSQNTPFVNIQRVIRSAMLRSGTWHAWTNNSIPPWGNRKEPCPSFEI